MKNRPRREGDSPPFQPQLQINLRLARTCGSKHAKACFASETALILRGGEVSGEPSVATLGGWGAVGSKVGVLTIRPTLLIWRTLKALASPKCGCIAKYP
jgi:hypothetical protein